MTVLYPSLVFDCDVPVAPVPKARPRVSNGRAYTPKRTKASEAIIASYVRSKYRGEIRTEPMGIKLICIHKRPKNLKGDGRVPKGTRPDGDNLLKLVLDACEGIVYRNDGQFCQYHVEDWYGKPKEAPHILLSLYVISW